MRRVPMQSWLNVANNLSLRPEHLQGLLPAPGRVSMHLLRFIAESCTKLAGTYAHEGTPKNILRELSISGRA